MTKEQAINLFKQLAEAYRGTRQEHVSLQEAIKTLENEVENTTNKKTVSNKK